MERTRLLLDGTPVEIDVPDATALPESTSIGVIRVGRQEIELTASGIEGCEFFLASTRTTPGSPLRLPDGRQLRLGGVGGDPTHGTAFVVELGEYRLFGSVPPAVSRTNLAGWLGLTTLDVGAHGVTVTLSPPARWVAERPLAVAQHVRTEDGTQYLLDIRRTTDRTPEPPLAGGLAVRGGRLHRSVHSDVRRHVILESRNFISYALPLSESDVDRVVSSMEHVTTETG